MSRSPPATGAKLWTPNGSGRWRPYGWRERTIIFPTRMNLQLLGEAGSAADATARARGRTLVTVEPKVERREGGGVLVIPPEAGYGAVEEPLSAIR